MKCIVAGVWSLGLALGAGAVYGRDYPSKPVRIITAAAGGGSDFTSRIIAQGISSPLGQQVIVDNRAGGVVSADAAAKAPPDGYTLFVTGGLFWTQPLLRKTPYDPIRDFASISLLARSVNIVAVHPSMPVRSVKELIALAKARPGELNYGSAGVGGTAHLTTELFKSMAGVNIVHVAYKGNGPALTDLIAGQIQLSITSADLITPYMKSGRLKALAVTSAAPSALYPGLPTVAASVPGYESVSMTGIFAPAKTPGPIINRLNQEIVRVVQRADVKERFLSSGSEPVGSSPEELGTAVKADMARWSKVIKDAGIKESD